MPFQRKKLIFALLPCLLAVFCAGQLRAGGEPLQGNVEEVWVPTDRLPLDQWRERVSPKLQPGVKWVDSLLPQTNTEDFWLPIPDWLAGVWHSETASFTGAVGNKFGESAAYTSRHDDSFGHQRDRNGGIWHLVRYPFVTQSQGDRSTSYFINYEVSGKAKNSFHIDLDADDIEVVVSRADKTIEQVRRRHDSSSWIKIGTHVSVDDRVTIGGASLNNGTIRTEPNRVSPFRAIDKLPDGYNVKSSFSRYLVNSGKSALLPNGSTNSALK